jgi:hypothetical protein
MNKLLSLAILCSVCAHAQSTSCDYDHLAQCTRAEVRDLLRENLVHYDSARVHVLKQNMIERKAAAEAVELLNEDATTAIQYWAVEILEELRSPATDALVRPAATTDLSVTAYNANLYFADAGDVTALRTLNDNYAQYPVPAYSWVTVMALFGQYKFKPATDHLVASIVAGNLSVADAAIASLVAICNPPRKDIDKFGAYPDIQKYFQAFLAAKNRPSG